MEPTTSEPSPGPDRESETERGSDLVAASLRALLALLAASFASWLAYAVERGESTPGYLSSLTCLRASFGSGVGLALACLPAALIERRAARRRFTPTRALAAAFAVALPSLVLARFVDLPERLASGAGLPGNPFTGALGALARLGLPSLVPGTRSQLLMAAVVALPFVLLALVRLISLPVSVQAPLLSLASAIAWPLGGVLLEPWYIRRPRIAAAVVFAFLLPLVAHVADVVTARHPQGVLAEKIREALHRQTPLRVVAARLAPVLTLVFAWVLADALAPLPEYRPIAGEPSWNTSSPLVASWRELVARNAPLAEGDDLAAKSSSFTATLRARAGEKDRIAIATWLDLDLPHDLDARPDTSVLVDGSPVVRPDRQQSGTTWGDDHRRFLLTLAIGPLAAGRHEIAVVSSLLVCDRGPSPVVAGKTRGTATISWTRTIEVEPGSLEETIALVRFPSFDPGDVALVTESASRQYHSVQLRMPSLAVPVRSSIVVREGDRVLERLALATFDQTGAGARTSLMVSNWKLPPGRHVLTVRVEPDRAFALARDPFETEIFGESFTKELVVDVR